MNGTGAILRLSITPLPQRGRGAGGEGSPYLPPQPLPLLHGERQGEMSRAAAILRLRHTRSPLSRSAGEGPGVRATPHLVPLSYTAQKYVGPPHAMIARVRDTPNERSAFSIRR